MEQTRSTIMAVSSHAQYKFSQKQLKQRRGPFAVTSRPIENESHTTLLIKWLSDVQRKDLSVTISGGALIGLNMV